MKNKNGINTGKKYLEILKKRDMFEFVLGTEFLTAKSATFRWGDDGEIVMEGISAQGKIIFRARFYPYHCEVYGVTAKGIQNVVYKGTYANHFCTVIARHSLLGETKLHTKNYIKDYYKYHNSVKKQAEITMTEAIDSLLDLGLINGKEANDTYAKLQTRLEEEKGDYKL